MPVGGLVNQLEIKQDQVGVLGQPHHRIGAARAACFEGGVDSAPSAAGENGGREVGLHRWLAAGHCQAAP